MEQLETKTFTRADMLQMAADLRNTSIQDNLQRTISRCKRPELLAQLANSKRLFIWHKDEAGKLNARAGVRAFQSLSTIGNMRDLMTAWVSTWIETAKESAAVMEAAAKIRG